MTPLSNEELLRQITTLINNLDNRVGKVEEIVDSTESRITVVESSLQSALEVVRAVKGHDGQPGTIVRIDRLEGRMASVEKWESQCPLLEVKESLFGTKKEAGLLEDMREMKKWKATMDRWGWMIAGTMVASIISLIITLLTK